MLGELTEVQTHIQRSLTQKERLGDPAGDPAPFWDGER